MRRTYRFGCRSLIAPTFANGSQGRPMTQLRTAADVSRLIRAAARCAWAQRTVAFAATAIALLCATSAFAAEPWSRDARAFHAEGFAEGVTTQSLAGGGLTPDPLAPDPGTVAYIIHTKGQAWAAVVVYDPTTRRYRQVCGLVGPFEAASDLHTFDPLLRSVLAAVHERGFPARVIDYAPDRRTVDLAQFEETAPPQAVTQRTAAPQSIVDIPAALPAPAPLTAQQTLTLLSVGGAALILTVLCLALILFLFFRHREQMAVVRTATRPAPNVAIPPAPAMATRPAQTAPRKAPPAPRPTAVPAPPPAATQQT